MGCKKCKKVVSVGGGTGPRNILEPLSRCPGVHITSVHSVFDSGGHAGRIRLATGSVAYGDLRRGFQALTPNETYKKLLAGRVTNPASESYGDSLGNYLILRCVELHKGKLERAVRYLNDKLFITRLGHQVLPVSLDSADLIADLVNREATVLHGEATIDQRNCDSWHSSHPIERVRIAPPATIYAPVVKAVKNADLIVFECGDVYTSLVPNILVEGFKEAVESSQARLVYIVNLMTKRNETHGWNASNFVDTFAWYLGKKPDVVLVNDHRQIPRDIASRYALEENAYPVEIDEKLWKFGSKILMGNFAEKSESGHLRHGKKVAEIILNL